MHDRRYRRIHRRYHIKRRLRLLQEHNANAWHRPVDITPGKLSNDSEVAANLTGGRSIKTNHRKGHSKYRCKGRYGSANNYKPHDKRQILRGNDIDDPTYMEESNVKEE